jgi:ATP-dependent RNA helicase DDX27
LALEADKDFRDTKSLNAAIRSAKKLNRPQKIGLVEQRSSSSKKKGIGKKRRDMFETELGRNAKTKEGVRPRKSSIGSGKRSQ